MRVDDAARPAPADRPGGPSPGLMSAIRGYQLARSGRPTGCRFLPTCSEYAIEAIQRPRRLVRGGRLAARRLLRCNPWGGHGVDPVPDAEGPMSHR